MVTPQSLSLDRFSGEDQVPAVGDLGVAKRRLELVDVVADAGGTDHVRYAIGVAGVLRGDAAHDVRVEIGQVRNLAFIQRQEHAGLDLAAKEVERGHHHVVVAATGEQFGFHHFVAVEHVVGDLDAGALFERGDGVFGDVVGVVVDVEHLGLCIGLARGATAATAGQQGDGQGQGEQSQRHVGLRAARWGGPASRPVCTQPTHRIRVCTACGLWAAVDGCDALQRRGRQSSLRRWRSLRRGCAARRREACRRAYLPSACAVSSSAAQVLSNSSSTCSQVMINGGDSSMAS